MKLSVAAVLIVYAAALVGWGGGAARAADATPAATSTCDNSTATKAIMTACTPYVMGATPLPMYGSGAYACCMALRSAPLACLCSRSSSSLSPYFLQLLNLQAVKNVMQTCAIQVPSGTSCAGVKLGN